jgi:hypothetical protein
MSSGKEHDFSWAYVMSMAHAMEVPDVRFVRPRPSSRTSDYWLSYLIFRAQSDRIIQNPKPSKCWQHVLPVLHVRASLLVRSSTTFTATW